ncbi:unnamed protein product [Laminaria digitata]
MMEAGRNMRRSVALLSLVAFASHRAVVRADDTLNGVISDAFDFAGQQLTVLADDVLVTQGAFTDYTNTEGQWNTVNGDDELIDKTVWTSGMVAGMFWYQYEYTGDNAWKLKAERMTEGLEGVEELNDNDLGFQAFDSFGIGYRLAGTEDYKDRVLTAAESLYDFRYQSNIPAFWSWDGPSRRPEWERAVNVDMMMNMEVMLWSWLNGGDAKYEAAVEEHADTTWTHIVRDDYSTFHVADFDPDTGDLVDQGTYQGWIDSSTWSRGQAWAIYGFVMVYRFLGASRFLDHSIDLLGYFEDNLPTDNVPFADFDAPLDSDNSKDSSSTAIVASALFEIFQVTGEAIYLEQAQVYLTSLLTSSSYYDPDAEDGWQSILRRSSARWSDPEVGAVFADYFLLEAMVRYNTMAPCILLRQEADVTVSSSGSGEIAATFDSAALDTDVDLSGLVASSSVIVWLGITLDNVDLVPTSLKFESGSATVSADISAPSGGWTTGANSVQLGLSAGTFTAGSWDSVSSVSVLFSESDGSASNDVVVNHLILGHRLDLSLENCSDDGDSCSSSMDCCSSTCTNGTCVAPAPPAFTSLGCFNDVKGDPVLSGDVLKRRHVMTTEKCAASCSGYAFFATRNGSLCYCGLSTDTPDALGDATCDVPCAGDASQTCGADSAISAYAYDV